MKKKHKKILIIGPFPKPITGNSLANKIVFQKLSQKKEFEVKKINTSLPFFDEEVGKFSFKKIIINLCFYLKAYKIFTVDLVYLTPGQSFFGVLKCAPFIFLSKLSFRKVIIHIHGNYLGLMYSMLSGYKKRIIKLILSKSDRGIVLSDSLRDNLKPFIKPNNIHSIYNFFEEELEKNTYKLIQNKSLDSLRIVYLSNLMKEKGIFDLLEALIELKRKNVFFEAKLAGNIDKSLKEEIEKYLKQLAPHVQYLGVVEGEDKKKLLLWSNTFVFPTYYKMEGQPISILEAMVTGNIVITTDHAGISDVFSKRNGFFVEKRSPKDISNILINLSLNNQLKEMMVFNYKYAKQNFTVNKYINSITELFLKSN